MPTLAETQTRFVAALRNRDAAPPPLVLGRGGEIPALRFDVYRNNVHVSLVNAIAAVYPTVERLVGPDFFRGMARVFVGEVLPQTPVLLDYGADFPVFIERFRPASTLPYLADVARIDWAWHRAYHAAESRSLTPRDLSAVPAEQLGGARFTLHPSAQALASPWPSLSIWTTNRHDDEVRSVNLRAGGEETLVSRPGHEVGVWHLPTGGSRFLHRLLAGKTLSDAAGATGAEFDLVTTLQTLLTSGAIAHYRF